VALTSPPGLGTAKPTIWGNNARKIPRLETINALFGGNKVILGVINHRNVFHHEDVGKPIAAGGKYVSSWEPPYPGVWRMTGRVTDGQSEYYPDSGTPNESAPRLVRSGQVDGKQYTSTVLVRRGATRPAHHRGWTSRRGRAGGLRQGGGGGRSRGLLARRGVRLRHRGEGPAGPHGARRGCPSRKRHLAPKPSWSRAELLIPHDPIASSGRGQGISRRWWARQRRLGGLFLGVQARRSGEGAGLRAPSVIKVRCCQAARRS